MVVAAFPVGSRRCPNQRLAIVSKGYKGPQLPFIRVIAKSLLKQNTVPRPSNGYKGVAVLCEDIRYDGKHHYPKELASRYHRCKVCEGRTNMACDKCEVPLHPKCFKNYHVK